MIVQLQIFNSQKEEVYQQSFASFGLQPLSLQQDRTLSQTLPSLMRIMDLTVKGLKKTAERTFNISGITVYILVHKGLFIALASLVDSNIEVYRPFAKDVAELALLSTQNHPHHQLLYNAYFSRSVGELFNKFRREVVEKESQRQRTKAWLELTDSIMLEEGKKVGRYVFAGSAAAGKSSIIAQFFQNWTQEQIQNIKPTIFRTSASHEEQFTKTALNVLDLGGQQSYITKHLQDPQSFAQVEALFFVIDLQSLLDTTQVQDYLVAILEKLKENNERPPLAILLHKFDPGMEAELGKKVTDWFEWLHTHLSKDELEFTIYLTSIKDNSSREAIARSLMITLPQGYLNFTIESNVITKSVNSLYPLVTQLQEELSKLDQERLEKELFVNSIPFGVESAKGLVDQWVRHLVNRSQGTEVTATQDQAVEQQGERVRLRLLKEERKLQIYIKCPLREAFFQERYKPICAVTKGIFEGLGRSLGLGEVRLVQTQIRDKADYCTIEVDL